MEIHKEVILTHVRILLSERKSNSDKNFRHNIPKLLCRPESNILMKQRVSEFWNVQANKRVRHNSLSLMELSRFKKCSIDPTRKSYFAGNHTKGLWDLW